MTTAAEVRVSAELSTPFSLSVPALPFSLDATCPIALPSRPSTSTPWPYAAAGPSTAPEEPVDAFIRRRYWETLYLSDILFPLRHLLQDLTHLDTSQDGNLAIANLLEPLLSTLGHIENRHRRSLQPLLIAFTAAASNPSSEIARNALNDALISSTLSAPEKDVLRVAMELRLDSRAISDGGLVDARKIRAELEKRETLMQVALLFMYISHAPSAAPQKRKRDKRRAGPLSVVDDPKAALDVLMDRLSVWSAISELESGQAGTSGENEVQEMLRSFWTDVIKPFFLHKQRDLCASFHLKVFAMPMPPDLAIAKEVTTTKKSRKPAMTRARPSSDALTQPDFRGADARPIAPARALSRAPSEAGTRRSPSRERSLSRSLSARPTESLEMRRSRSRSIDPAPANEVNRLNQPKKGLMRAPSGGKDLFKGRQVGLLKRNSSLIVKRPSFRESQSQGQAGGQAQGSLGLGRSESLARVGLLGRKTSDPKGRRNSEEGQSQTQNQPGTLVFATPSKPKLADSIFGPRLGFVAPTPIREEPASTERPTYITETPHSFGRMSKAVDMGPGGGVAETPETSTRTFAPSTGRSYAGMAINALNSIERIAGSDDEGDLGDLMVMTDEEDDDDERGTDHGFLVPDTPAK